MGAGTCSQLLPLTLLAGAAFATNGQCPRAGTRVRRSALFALASAGYLAGGFRFTGRAGADEACG